jgi:hypothetical protein
MALFGIHPTGVVLLSEAHQPWITFATKSLLVRIVASFRNHPTGVMMLFETHLPGLRLPLSLYSLGSWRHSGFTRQGSGRCSRPTYKGLHLPLTF